MVIGELFGTRACSPSLGWMHRSAGNLQPRYSFPRKLDLWRDVGGPFGPAPSAQYLAVK
jgi:hypothetical protein